ncbi:MAG: zinc-dependent alcohol dehydrogenase family protein [Oleiphilaceae bacterium]|nr:zinc-dependent alcohol dehydrogenase family protein [Oleiphilaceae bacterium]
MMKAQYDQRGPVPEEHIEAVAFEPPALKAGEARVEVLAAPINPSDVLTLTGEYGILPPLPAVGGNEGVGRVTELGPDTENPALGQTVLLPMGVGTWASHVVTDARKLVPLPNEADPRQLSMMTINPPTAMLMLSVFVDLKPGDWVIQNAANSGVGGYLIQLARIRGFKTVNVVRRESAIDSVKAEGGEVVLVDGPDLAKRVKAVVGEGQVRLAIDAVGGPATDHIADCLTEGGTVVNYGMMSGESCHLSPRNLVFRGISARGFWLAKWFESASQEEQIQLFGQVTKLIAQGKLQARIAAEYDVSEIKEAVAAAAAGEREGKVLIVPRHE